MTDSAKTTTYKRTPYNARYRPRYIRSWRTGHIEQDYDGKFYYVDHSGQRHNINFVRDGVSETGVLDEARQDEN